MFVNPTGMSVADMEIFVAQNLMEDGNIGIDALYTKLTESAFTSRDGIAEIFGCSMTDYLGQQRIKGVSILIPRVAKTIRTDARPIRCLISC